MIPALQNQVTEFSQAHNLPGISVSVRHDENNYCASSGEFTTPTDQSLVYSLTKTFSAVACLQLFANKQLELDSPVSDWLPEIPFMSQITTRQLLNHSSGLPDYGALSKYHDAVRTTPSKPWSDTEFLQNVLTDSLQFEPGYGWSYSNIGYLILRLLMQQITQGSYQHAVSSFVLEPFGLEQIRVAKNKEDLYTLVPGHSQLCGTTAAGQDIRSVYHPGWVATGVLASTANDISSFYHNLFTSNILHSKELSAMCQLVTVPYEHPHFENPSYGLGLMSFNDSKLGVAYGHSGEGPGYSAACYHFIDKELTIAALCNSETAAKAENLILQLWQTIQHPTIAV